VSDTHEEIRALRVMVEELKAEPPPELPWDAIEQQLLARLPGQGSAAARARARWSESPMARMVGLCAAAAAIALSVNAATPRAAATASQGHLVDVAVVALAPGQPGDARDLRALVDGDLIETADAPVTFARSGLVAWTLAPHSAARVRTMGDGASGVGHTLSLARGSIRAEVVPRDPAEGLVEAFAVEAAGTRVAVHGTAFSVAILDGRAVVDVEHGAVAVGPIGYRGATTGHLLVGPSRASFSLDGARSARMLARAPEPVAALEPAPLPVLQPLPARTALAEPTAEPAPVAPEHGAVASPPAPVAARAPEAPAPAVPAAPVAVDPAPAPAALPLLTVGSVQSSLDRCFRRVLPGSSSVQIQLSSTLRFQLAPDGKVLGARFDPPLKPELQSCAEGVFAGRFAPGPAALDVPVSFKQ
jgi:hypothetical protein